MNEALSWIATGIVLALAAALVVALLSLRHVPLAERPKTQIYDRVGHPIGMTENPDYHANPGEDPSGNPDLPTVPERDS